MLERLAQFRNRLAKNASRFVAKMSRLHVRQPRMIFIAVCLIVGVLVVGHHVHAADPTYGDQALGILGSFLSLLIFALGKFLLVLVGVLIKIASYNNFVNAQPVQFGWVLVRDLTNMFFIVILLVSAFATIIGYPADFHYSKILPKLLLMVVLINFSKTLLGLLIDFSQVIMLTFVSAFQQAAGGNFIKALKLDQLTTLNTDHPDGLGTTELLASSIFGIFLLLISLTIVLIMIAFLVFRVITIWMLLIMSPLAFFATALPSKIGNELGGVGADFWKKLRQVLVSGPIMAFFLWLALAVVQSAPEPFGDIYSSKDASAETLNAVNFATKAGNGGAIAQFIVVVAFLLEGVEYAAGAATSGIVPKRARGLLGLGSGSGSDIVMGFLKNRYKPLLLGTGAGAVAGLAAGVGTTGAAAAVGLTAAYKGRNAIGAGIAKGTKGKIDPRKLPIYFGKDDKGHFKLMGMKERGQQVRGDFEKKTKFLDFASKMKKLEKEAASFDLTKATAAQTMLADMALSGGSQKELAKKYESEIQKENPFLSVDQVSAMAERQAVDKRAQLIAVGLKSADTLKLSERKEAYDKALFDNPALAKDFSKHADKKNAGITDWKKHIESIGKDAMKDSATFAAELVALEMIDPKTGQIIRNASNEDRWEKLSGGDRGRLVQAHVNRYSSDPNGILAQLEAMDDPSDAKVKAANAARTYVTKVKDGDGKMQSVAVPWVVPVPVLATTIGPAAAPSAYIPPQRRSGVDVAAGKASLDALPAGTPAATMVPIQRTMIAHGATFGEAFKFNQGQAKFADTVQEVAYTDTMIDLASDVMAAAPNAYEDLANLDLEALKANERGSNDARTRFMLKVTPDVLRTAYTQATAAGPAGENARKRILEMINIQQVEAERVEHLARTNDVDLAHLQTFATTPGDALAMAAHKDLIDSGAVASAIEADAAAQALEAGEKIKTDPGFRAIRQKVLGHARERAKSAHARRFNS